MTSLLTLIPLEPPGPPRVLLSQPAPWWLEEQTKLWEPTTLGGKTFRLEAKLIKENP